MLDERQQEAVAHNEGPCLTIAGPGSGKTTVLVQRILTLISTCHVDPAHILVITFTKDAARQMQRRCFLAPDLGQKAVVFGTFHSVFYRILNDQGRYSAQSIITGRRRYDILRECLARAGIRGVDDNAAGLILREISYVVNADIAPEEYHPSTMPVDAFCALFHSYERIKREHGLIDFDDMLTRTEELLTTDHTLLAHWQDRFQRILIDEAQDMNRVQFRVIRLLGTHGNLFLVGDDDQSVYGFRGADPGILMSFKQYYPQAKIITLEKNYRSDRRIVEGALRLISHNTHRFDKDIVSSSTDNGCIRLFCAEDPSREAELITDSIRRMRRMYGANRTCAVLFRTRAEAHALILALTERQIPFYMKERMDNVYEHPVTEDILSYLRVACGMGRLSDYLRIANRPVRYISTKSLDMPRFSWEGWLSYYHDKPWMQARISVLRRQMTAASDMTPYAAVNYVRHAAGYEEYLKSCGSRCSEMTAIADELQTLASRAAGRGAHSLERFIRQIEAERERLECARGGSRSGDTDGIGLYTFHGSKGLEFDRVYILDANEGITPSKRATDPAGLEEERRMFYVAVTRARKEVYIYTIRRRNNERLAPSRFLEELMPPAEDHK